MEKQQTRLSFRIEQSPPRNREIMSLLTYSYCDYPYMMDMTFVEEVWDWMRENGFTADVQVYESLDPWGLEPTIDVLIGFSSTSDATLFKMTWIG